MEDGEAAQRDLDHLSTFSGLRVEQIPTRLVFASELPEYAKQRYACLQFQPWCVLTVLLDDFFVPASLTRVLHGYNA